ncbi:MAG: DUF2058 domain-containing protein [Methylococcales bacterium]|nr:DUF2058 domain-containing protein [Methylococcales bacterium]
MKNQSLQDQLLNAGLSNNTKAKQVRAEKRKQTKRQQKNKVAVVDEAKLALQEKNSQQQEKDKLLNDKRNKEAEKKQIASQIIQLINLNKIAKDEESEGAAAYKFTDHNVVKSIFISDELRTHIIVGRLAIVKAGKAYEVVSTKVAEKIQQRDENTVIVLFTNEQSELTEVDEYAGYEIPDDLMW